MNIPYRNSNDNIMIVIGIILLVLIISLAVVVMVRAEEIDLKAIAQIESNNNPQAVSYTGAKYGRGLYQISEICLKDYNQQNNAKLAPTSLFDPETNEEVAKWYLTQRIPFIFANWGIPVTTINVLWAYNAGVGRVRQGIMPKETKSYLAKYAKLGGSHSNGRGDKAGNKGLSYAEGGA